MHSFWFFPGMILHVDHTALTASLLSEKTNCKTVCTMLCQLCVYVCIWLEAILIPAGDRTLAAMGTLYTCPVHMLATSCGASQRWPAWLRKLKAELHLTYICVYGGTCVCAAACVEVKGHLYGVTSWLPLCWGKAAPAICSTIQHTPH